MFAPTGTTSLTLLNEVVQNDRFVAALKIRFRHHAYRVVLQLLTQALWHVYAGSIE